MAYPLDVVLGRLVAASAEAEPDRICLVFENGELPEERLTRAEVAVQSNKLAHALHAAGLRKGDRIGVILRNHPEFVYALVACSKLGLVSVPVDPRSRGEKLRYFLTFAECAALLTAVDTIGEEVPEPALAETGGPPQGAGQEQRFRAGALPGEAPCAGGEVEPSHGG